MQQRLPIKRSPIRNSSKGGLISALLTYLPGAWINPSENELISLYRQRYRMALEDRKYDAAMIFLNKILEVDPLNLEAKLRKGELYHYHLGDYSRAVEQYNKIIRFAPQAPPAIHDKARTSLAEIMEMLS